MTAGVLVEAATVDDADALWELVAAFATSTVPDVAAFGPALHSALADERAVLLVARAGTAGELVGYLGAVLNPTLFATAPVAVVQEVMVRDDRRGSGIGRALVGAAEEWARASGAAYVSLATRRAEDFYLALGYEASATFLKKPLD